ncbi:MAG: hypothetical protein GX413_10775 [Acetobacter sp.]|nr:hypothetical protein [Acetobacter sp.]
MNKHHNWRSFTRLLLFTAFGSGLLLWLFISLVDPWDVLPFSPDWQRIPISTNARYSMPALAKNQTFTSAMIGTSTGRLLQPQQLDALFNTHFVNLAMNSATPWEQRKILRLFLRSHPKPDYILIDVDQSWCSPKQGELSSPARPFPTWMYDGSATAQYLHMTSFYAIQEAANQFAWLTGHKKQRYGSDGYTNFLPPDSSWNEAKVDAKFRAWPTHNAPANNTKPDMPGMAFLTDLLSDIPPGTKIILWSPPVAADFRGAPGTMTGQIRESCDAHMGYLTHLRPDITAVTFNLDDPRLSARHNFWDPIHFRAPLAAQIGNNLLPAAQNQDSPDGFYKILR